MPDIPQTSSVFNYEEFKNQFLKYAQYDFVKQADEAIDIVLGSDCLWSFSLPETKIQIADYILSLIHI